MTKPKQTKAAPRATAKAASAKATRAKTTRTKAKSVSARAKKAPLKTKKLPFSKRHLIIAHTLVIALFIAIGIFVYAQVSQNYGKDGDVSAASCKARDTKVYTRYPITGYFLFTNSNPCSTQTSIEGMHKIGADTAMTFGSTLKEMSPGALRSDSLYRNFKEGNRHGYDIAWANTSGGRISRVFTYSDKMIMGSAAHMCGSRDGTIRNSSGVFDWFLVPTDAGYSDCTSPSKTYDLIVSSSRSKQDANTNLINSANAYGMKVYLGLPKVAMETDARKGPRIDYSHTFGSFTTRVLKSWQQQYGKNPAFAGVYQTQETVVNGNIGKRVLDLYALQHKIIAWQLQKDKQVVVISPYARMLRSSGTTLASITEAARKIGRTASDAGVWGILMPQDGAGTGHVGLYDAFQSKSKIRPEGASTVGTSNTTNAQAYMGNTKDLYWAVKVSGYTTWANVEAFRPGGKIGNRPLTSRATLDTQVRTSADQVSKVVAYRWNDYMTKKSGVNGNISLQQSILKYGNKPFVSGVGRIPGGVRIVGYKLNTGKASYVVVNSNGRSVKIRTDGLQTKTTLGGRLQYVDVTRSGLVPGKSVYVLANNGHGNSQTLGSFY